MEKIKGVSPNQRQCSEVLPAGSHMRQCSSGSPQLPGRARERGVPGELEGFSLGRELRKNVSEEMLA